MIIKYHAHTMLDNVEVDTSVNTKGNWTTRVYRYDGEAILEFESISLDLNKAIHEHKRVCIAVIEAMNNTTYQHQFALNTKEDFQYV